MERGGPHHADRRRHSVLRKKISSGDCSLAAIRRFWRKSTPDNCMPYNTRNRVGRKWQQYLQKASGWSQTSEIPAHSSYGGAALDPPERTRLYAARSSSYLSGCEPLAKAWSWPWAGCHLRDFRQACDRTVGSCCRKEAPRYLTRDSALGAQYIRSDKLTRLASGTTPGSEVPRPSSAKNFRSLQHDPRSLLAPHKVCCSRMSWLRDKEALRQAGVR